MSHSFPLRTRSVVEFATSVSGYPIVVESDPALQVWSSTRLPRNDERTCLITYHPERAKYLDYLVAHECGHIYRFFSAKPEDRLVSVTDREELARATRQVNQENWPLKKSIPKYWMKEFLECLCYGLVRQLTNTPADCRIEPWIYDNFGFLRDVQASALRELHSTSIKCLGKEIKQATPPSIYRNSNAMNYVLAKTTYRLLNEPDLLAPYLEAGFLEQGERLHSYFGSEDRGYIDDMRVADAWGRESGIDGWYEWRKPE